MNDQPDPYAGQGGSYIKNADGTRTRVEEPTLDHPDGNKARPAVHSLRSQEVHSREAEELLEPVIPQPAPSRRDDPRRALAVQTSATEGSAPPTEGSVTNGNATPPPPRTKTINPGA